MIDTISCDVFTKCSIGLLCLPAIIKDEAIPDLDDISAWQYDLPEELIASRPTAQRDGARLMVVHTQTGSIEHHRVTDLPRLLNAGDRLVFNNTKVLPARLFGFRTSTKGKWEGLFLNVENDGRWRITGQTRGRMQPGESLTLVAANGEDAPESCELQLTEQLADGSWLVKPDPPGEMTTLLETFGTLPLPPYIGRKVADDEDRIRYQTMFARESGAIAAPTAGLHFTHDLLNECAARGLHSSEVTLHVGIGTFRPVNTQKLSNHRMHAEWFRVDQTTADEIALTRESGGKVVAVGTTSVRTLESASSQGKIASAQGDTNLFIQPGFAFRTVDQLLTNFHLPGSTLIVLVAALAGYDLTMEAYHTAVREKYRFYSYGDAMLIL